jgi:hypothetical protein
MRISARVGHSTDPAICGQVCECQPPMGSCSSRVFNSDRFRFSMTNVVSGIYCRDALSLQVRAWDALEGEHSGLHFNMKGAEEVTLLSVKLRDMCQAVCTTSLSKYILFLQE